MAQMKLFTNQDDTPMDRSSFMEPAAPAFKGASASSALEQEMFALGERAQAAAYVIARATTEQKNNALVASANAIRAAQRDILMANSEDMESGAAKGLSPAMMDRLKLTPDRIEAMARGIEDITKLPEPVGRELARWNRPNGLDISRVSVPLGVIGIIYESRPNVTADAGALCIKSGNAAILRGGSDSLHSSQAIVKCLHAGLKEMGLPEDVIQLVATRDRDAVGIMLRMTNYIDVIVPRGGKALTQRIMEESRIPTLQHLEGNCHSYIHRDADDAMAIDLVVNAKMRRTGVCGATESIVMDRDAAQRMLSRLTDALIQAGCEVRGDAEALKLDPRIQAANEEDWGKEYLDAIISVKIVDDIEQAVRWVNMYGSHHTDAIITRDKKAADYFLKNIDSAIVLHNASTQFADGGEFGMGAEIGIATGKLHARGPVGVEQLTTFKYIVRGEGQIRPK